LHEHHLSFEGLSDLSVVLLQNAYEMTSPFADASRCVTPLLIIAKQTANKHKVCCSDGVQITVDGLYSSIFPSFSRFYSAICPNSAEHLMLNST